MIVGNRLDLVTPYTHRQICHQKPHSTASSPTYTNKPTVTFAPMKQPAFYTVPTPAYTK